MKVNIMDTSKPYEIRPASEGGLTVFGDAGTFGSPRVVIAAFSNASDLIRWLAEQHDVTAAVGYELPPQIVNELADSGKIQVVCDAVMEWEGKFFPDKGKGLPCVARLRNGDAITIHTGEDDGCQWTWQHRGRQPHDVVAYWLV
jgi:hypothetical protein